MRRMFPESASRAFIDQFSSKSIFTLSSLYQFRYDSKKKGRIDVMDFLKAVDSISKEFPTVLDVDYPAINLAFKTRAIGEGISLNEFLDAVTELVSAFGATSPKISKHKENEVIPRVKEPPAASTELIQEASLFNSRRASTDRRKLRGDGTFRSPSNAPPTTDHDRLEHDSNIRKRGTASLKLVDIKNATIRGINDIGRWFGVREDGESELIIRRYFTSIRFPFSRTVN